MMTLDGLRRRFALLTSGALAGWEGAGTTGAGSCTANSIYYQSYSTVITFKTWIDSGKSAKTKKE